MTDIPASFLDLHRATPGAGRLRTPLAQVADRHEFCEDLAQLLVDTARGVHADLRITEDDVLDRIGRGLRGPDAPVDADEATWVVRRLAELLRWDPPADAPVPTGDGGEPDRRLGDRPPPAG